MFESPVEQLVAAVLFLLVFWLSMTLLLTRLRHGKAPSKLDLLISQKKRERQELDEQLSSLLQLSQKLETEENAASKLVVKIAATSTPALDSAIEKTETHDEASSPNIEESSPEQAIAAILLLLWRSTLAKNESQQQKILASMRAISNGKLDMKVDELKALRDRVEAIAREGVSNPEAIRNFQTAFGSEEMSAWSAQFRQIAVLDRIVDQVTVDFLSTPDVTEIQTPLIDKNTSEDTGSQIYFGPEQGEPKELL